MRARGSGGFTMVEVVVSAIIIAITAIGMSSVMTSYATTRNRTNALAVAQSVAQAELDDVLMHNQIENSLMSDTQQRSRPIYLQSNQVTVSNYFYCNFPWDPGVPLGVDHNQPGMIWNLADIDVIPGPSWDRFAANRLYDRGGRLLIGTAVNDVNVSFVGRLQVFGATDAIDNVEEYIDGATSSACPHGNYLDSTAISPNLIADTCANTNGLPFHMANMVQSPLYNDFRTKIFVVRIYSKPVFMAPSSQICIGSGGGAKTEICHSFTVINGKVRL